MDFGVGTTALLTQTYVTNMTEDDETRNRSGAVERLTALRDRLGVRSSFPDAVNDEISQLQDKLGTVNEDEWTDATRQILLARSQIGLPRRLVSCRSGRNWP